ncbi:hypothetical protein [Salinisphaera hydrothermalis]|uniref:Ribbon-helix-helix protein CopG domain-containing protein n=1 Tax=Salinisphaera hydrothermalis (strain C41B8) TaxID=1304275 RepID=A0A084IG85_SALHC|nr:hypothetical protein [Salinisphaera hydrothermalis]KEZ75719.1 hypothetical protein C41B8_18567 [Salinisphaera hydrothermalis C41B8]
MPAAKTATLTFRIDPSVKEGLRVIAEREHRSLANTMEMLIRDHCDRNGIVIPEQGTLFDKALKPAEPDT